MWYNSYSAAILLWLIDGREVKHMGQTDKQFGGFLRMLIARMRNAISALRQGNNEQALKLMQEIMDDLQNTLED